MFPKLHQPHARHKLAYLFLAVLYGSIGMGLEVSSLYALAALTYLSLSLD